MRIFTKKSFEFKNADGETVTTRPLDFADVPEWAAQDPIFGWGVKDGDITVTENAKDESAAEKAAAEAEAKAKAEADAREAAAKAEAEAKAEADAREAAAKAEAEAKAAAKAKGK